MFTTDNPLQGPVTMDLQMFNDGAGEPTPATLDAQPAQSGDPTEGVQNPLLQTGSTEVPETGEPATEPQDGPQEPDKQDGPQDLILGKFKSPEDLAKSYQEAERKIAQQGQQLAEMQKQWQELQGKLQQLGQPQSSQLAPEQIQEINEQWLNKFYEDPLRAIAEVTQQIVESRVQPLNQFYQQQQEVERWNQQLEEVRQAHEDFDALLPEIEQVIEEQGDALANLPNAIEVAYNLAKSRQAKTPEQLLQDPEFRQKILQDETIRNEILKSYATEVKQGKPPVVIGNQPGEPPAAPPTDIKSTSDAKKATISYFARLLGGGSK